MKLHFNLQILVAIVLFLFVTRIVVENKIQILHKSKRNWIVWGICLAVSILSYFITIATMSLILNAMVIGTVFVMFAIAGDENKKIKTVIFSNNIVLDANNAKAELSSFDKILFGKEAMEKKTQKARKSADSEVITIHKTLKGMQMVNGIPILGTNFSWKPSPMATQEQYGRALQQLSRFYYEYNWQISPPAGSKKRYIYATIMNNKTKVVKFDKTVSDGLPWYIVPLGVTDPSTKSSARKTVYCWKMHDDDHKEWPALKGNTTKFIAGAHAMTIGATGGGKSVWITTILAHWINKNVVDIWISDPKGGAEFGKYEELPQVRHVAKNLPDTVEIIDKFALMMSQRYMAMDVLGINAIPLEGYVDTSNAVIVDGNFFKMNNRIKVKYNDKETIIHAKDIQLPCKVLTAGNKDFKIDPEWIDATEENTQIGGEYLFKAQVFIADEYAELVDNRPNSDYRMVDDLKTRIQSIAAKGRAARIQLVIATQSASSSLFPMSLKNNIPFRTVCGRVDTSVSMIALDNELAASIPIAPGSYLSQIKGEALNYQGYFTKSDDAIKLSGFTPSVNTDSSDNDDEEDNLLPEDPEDDTSTEDSASDSNKIHEEMSVPSISDFNSLLGDDDNNSASEEEEEVDKPVVVPSHKISIKIKEPSTNSIKISPSQSTPTKHIRINTGNKIKISSNNDSSSDDESPLFNIAE